MSNTSIDQIIARCEQMTRRTAWEICTCGDVEDVLGRGIDELDRLQSDYCTAFPEISDEVRFWETLWRYTDTLRDQWDRLERVLNKRRDYPSDHWQEELDRGRHRLYGWTRDWIERNAPRVPEPAHFELGIGRRRPDARGLHQRVEGLYEAIKRVGEFPEIRRDVEREDKGVNFGLIYGGGWNVSTYSILREAAKVEGIRALCTFDHPGPELFDDRGGRTVRVAPAGMYREAEGRYVLCSFRDPPVMHFLCPHQWTPPPGQGGDPELRTEKYPRPDGPRMLGVPLLRSDYTLEIVNDKSLTGQALRWYREETGADIPLISEATVSEPEVYPADPDEMLDRAGRALDHLKHESGTEEVVVKPGFGMEETDVEYFTLPAERNGAVEHAAHLAVECGAVIQERIRPQGGLDFNWRVMTALDASGEPKVVGRFARLGHHEEMEMVRDREMLHRAGVTGERADAFLSRLDEVSLGAFRAVVHATRRLHPDVDREAVAGRSPAIPYFLGVDLIGDARVMEINGHEVGGLWTDDRLYPQTRGRSMRTVLKSAREAGREYREELELADR